VDQHRLRKDLERLQEELAQTSATDERSGAALAKLRQDIQTLLNQREPVEAHQYQSIGDQLRDTVYHFDASHPQLASTMAQVIDSLALFNL